MDICKGCTIFYMSDKERGISRPPPLSPTKKFSQGLIKFTQGKRHLVSNYEGNIDKLLCLFIRE